MVSKLTLVVVTWMAASCLVGVDGFSPGSLLSVYGDMGSHHGEITKCALHEIAIKYLAKMAADKRPDDLNSKRTKRSLGVVTVTNCTTEDEVMEMCKSPAFLTEMCQGYKDAVQKIVAFNAVTDKLNAEDPFAHFSAEMIYETNRQLMASKQAVMKVIGKSGDYVTGRQHSGRIFHTIQVRSN
jgi:hypothetical protein